MDGLDEFEKSLAAEKAQRERDERREHKHRRRHRDHDEDRERRRHRHRGDEEATENRDGRGHRRHRRDDDDRGDEHRHKRSRRDGGERDEDGSRRRHRHRDEDREHRHSRYRDDDSPRDPKKDLPLPDDEEPSKETVEAASAPTLERDSWMTAPSGLDVDYIHRPRPKTPPKSPPKPQREIHSRELNASHLASLNNGATPDEPALEEPPARRTVDYEFGDKGSSWRMTKLRTVFTASEETGRPVEEVALERYGNLEEFDDAREEKEELERRRVYGTGYEMKKKPSGELYQERLREIRTTGPPMEKAKELDQGTVIPDEGATAAPVMDQTALNRLRAQMMKAKMRRAPNAAELEEEYNRAAAAAAAAGPSSRGAGDAVVIGAMENRMLAGTRGEVKAVTSRRGRERGNVEENEDMSIEDMVREERRTKGMAGGDAMRQAERIAKDVKYTDDLDYMDDNAEKLARRVHKSEANLRNVAVSEFQKLNRVLDSCPLCHHDESGRPPIAPVVSLATRTFLTLPTEPEVSPGGAVIVPLTHRRNLLECDDDEWEEMRNFMKSLTRMYHAQGREAIFYENAAAPQQHRHAAMVAVPVPYEEGAMAPAHFREAFLSSDAEWSQHRPVIDTQKAATEGGMGRLAFRRSIAKEMPYFHAWFTLDGGLGHVVEDSGRWPKGDLFAREVVGGIVGAEPHIVKKQGRWVRNGEGARVEAWKKDWRKFDWTRVLEG
ncbi:Pre-mRNA-splicing factor-like protein [Hapsidospora chrysogenum ATCC 11550]|uniref:Pre-mRNA-splicing factor-like protein n=1 Tax=Hapsidospora chrysogenum (strain ATCC 11550 / CBS 779.69 / DSM 880 / IAM 14645 / JCM 23072 / IMI 49137) TaxID=857340 RepID=A0A086T4J3_HAPC1|nr:Pre-mRNA-splicing factor-like protein [Hapsidospora chrysogenum ATCC 11550]